MENTNTAPVILKVVAWIIIVLSSFSLLPALGAAVSNSDLNVKATFGLLSIVAILISAVGLLKLKKWGLYLYTTMFIYHFLQFLINLLDHTRQGSEAVLFVALSNFLLFPALLLLIYLLVIRKRFS